MNILFIGDVFANPGRRAVKELLPGLKKKFATDFTIANGENGAGGFGITPAVADELLASGIDVLTSGNHIFNSSVLGEYMEKTNRLLRPINYPPGNPGLGLCLIKVGKEKIGVINAIGRIFLSTADCPFRTVEEALNKIALETKLIVIDIHAEATSEKMALAHYFDGRVSLVAGTHTHVQTADEQILPNGTAYISDAGMTGPHDSIIGVKKEIIIHKFLYQHSKRFEPATGDIRLNGVHVEVDSKTGKAIRIERINEPLVTE
jgi:2',3'-cyclic-nucleotide 2'-phosphodiesterase